jgi:curved DNA-binding protein CbpA
MPSRNPFTVLELPLDADGDAIKAAWRRLARQHHPDVLSGDQAVERRATRRMAEINAAYHELSDPDRRAFHRDAAARAAASGSAHFGRATHTPGGATVSPEDWPYSPDRGYAGVPPISHERPVTARIDTSALLRPRNSTLQPLERSPLPGLPPRPRSVEGREPPRASTPTGPMHRRHGAVPRMEMPSLGDALEMPVRFGKFAGLTLGDVADLEPTYVDWVVRTIDRDPELALAARVVLRHLERTGAFDLPAYDAAADPD